MGLSSITRVQVNSLGYGHKPAAANLPLVQAWWAGVVQVYTRGKAHLHAPPVAAPHLTTAPAAPRRSLSSKAKVRRWPNGTLRVKAKSDSWQQAVIKARARPSALASLP